MPIMLTAATGTVDTLITDLTKIGGYALEQVPNIGDAITSTPVLVLGLGFFLIGGAIGIFGRLIHRG